MHYAKPGEGTDGSKMILVMVLIQQYQNGRLKACNNLPGILFISFVKD